MRVSWTEKGPTKMNYNLHNMSAVHNVASNGAGLFLTSLKVFKTIKALGWMKSSLKRNVNCG